MENNGLLENLIGKDWGLLGGSLEAELLPISRPISRRLSQSRFPISPWFALRIETDYFFLWRTTASWET